MGHSNVCSPLSQRMFMKGCEEGTHVFPALLWSLVSPRDRARSPYRSTHSRKVRGEHWGVGVVSVSWATSFPGHSTAEQATGFPRDARKLLSLLSFFSVGRMMATDLQESVLLWQVPRCERGDKSKDRHHSPYVFSGDVKGQFFKGLCLSLFLVCDFFF